MMSCIMWARCRFWVILNRKDRKCLMLHPFTSIIVEIHVRHHNIFIFERIHVDRETVILRGDVYATGLQVLHRLIATMMTKF